MDFVKVRKFLYKALIFQRSNKEDYISLQEEHVSL